MIVATLPGRSVERRGDRAWALTGPEGERLYKTKRAALAALAECEEEGVFIDFHDDDMANNLVKRAKAHGYGPAALAEILGVSRATLEAWQCGRYPISGPARKLLEYIIAKGNMPMKTYIATSAFLTPPENQGQIVTVSYALDAEAEVILEKIYDASDKSLEYQAYAYPEDDDDVAALLEKALAALAVVKMAA